MLRAPPFGSNRVSHAKMVEFGLPRVFHHVFDYFKFALLSNCTMVNFEQEYRVHFFEKSSCHITVVFMFSVLCLVFFFTVVFAIDVVPECLQIFSPNGSIS